MKEEYKKTPLGDIPIDWETIRLSEVAEVKGRIGYRGYTKTDLVAKGAGVLTIGGSQISNQNKLILSQPVYLSWEKYEESPEIKVKEGNIVFAQRGTLGRTAIIDSLPEPATINPSMVLIKNIRCSNKFLYYFLCSSYIQNAVKQISTATAVPMISQKQINEFFIPNPPLPEQQKIADILSIVDEKIDSIEQRIAETHELKKGLMQRLLTKGIGHTRFKDSALGEIPESWEVVKIEDVALVKGRIGYRGYTRNDIVEKGDGAISTSPSNINTIGLNFNSCTYISWFKYDESPEIQISIDDILLVKTGSSFGKAAIVKKLPEKATINPQLVIIKSKNCRADFLYYIIKDRIIQNQITSTIVGGAIPTLSQKNILNFILPCPPLYEQQEIADILSSIDEKLDVLQNKKQEYEQLKKGLMQQLLTGKIRVQV